MSGLIDGQYHFHINRRSAEIGLGSGSSSQYFTNSGDSVIDGPSDGKTGLITLVQDSSGARRKIETNGTLNDSNYIRGDHIWRREFDTNFYCRFKINSISNMRFFIGLTSLSPDNQVANDSPASGHYCGIKKELANSNFEFTSCDGSVVKDTSTIAASTSVLDFYMWMKRQNRGNAILFQLGNNTRIFHTVNLPANTQNLGFVVAIKDLVGAFKSVEIGRIHLDALF